ATAKPADPNLRRSTAPWARRAAQVPGVGGWDYGSRVNRTDRLYAIVEELRARSPRPTSAATLAQRFEVSTRTIERDLLALQESGVPIYAETGRTGGYVIDAARSLPPVNFTAAEAAAVAVALTTAADTPFAMSARSALTKMIAAMHAPDRDAAR